MAVGWSRDEAVQEQIDATVESADAVFIAEALGDIPLLTHGLRRHLPYLVD
jgi:hypothetical protein